MINRMYEKELLKYVSTADLLNSLSEALEFISKFESFDVGYEFDSAPLANLCDYTRLIKKELDERRTNHCTG